CALISEHARRPPWAAPPAKDHGMAGRTRARSAVSHPGGKPALARAALSQSSRLDADQSRQIRDEARAKRQEPLARSPSLKAPVLPVKLSAPRREPRRRPASHPERV